jgi:hypothetical protein
MFVNNPELSSDSLKKDASLQISNECDKGLCQVSFLGSPVDFSLQGNSEIMPCCSSSRLYLKIHQALYPSVEIRKTNLD